MSRKHDAADAIRDKLAQAEEIAEELLQSAADKAGPLAQSAADRIEAAAERIGPLAHSAADRVGPLAHAAADNIGPWAHQAADRVRPLAHQAAERVSDTVQPLAHSAAEAISPYAHQAAGKVSDTVQPFIDQASARVSPIAHDVADRVGPFAESARKHGAKVAHDAAERISPVLNDYLDKVPPALEAARDRVNEDVIPRLRDSLNALAETPAVTEATKRGHAVAAAARGELALPEKKSKGRWVVRILVVGAVAGAAVLVVRRLLGSSDADWQAARPSTTPYVPTRAAENNGASPAATSTAPSSPDTAPATDSTESSEGASTVGLNADELAAASAQTAPELSEPVAAETDAGSDTGSEEEDGTAAEVADLTTDGDEPTASLAADESAVAPLTESEDIAPVEANSEEGAASADGAEPENRWGHNSYVGENPPEGFVIKGNERSMKYHLPESGGYNRTHAEVWFTSEEDAEAAGFVRAQR